MDNLWLIVIFVVILLVVRAKPLMFFLFGAIWLYDIFGYLFGFKVYSKSGSYVVTEEQAKFAFVFMLVLMVVGFLVKRCNDSNLKDELQVKSHGRVLFKTGKCPTCKEVYDSERFDLYECPTCNEKLIEVGKYYDLHPEERG